jgi:hypothetical protein
MNLLSKNLLVISLAFLFSCGDDCVEPQKEESSFVGVHIKIDSEGARCGSEIKLINGFENVGLLTDGHLDDSLFYVKSLPIEIGDTFNFTARKSKQDEFYMCDPLFPVGDRQIVIQTINN